MLLYSGLWKDRSAGRDRDTPEQPLPDLPPGSAGPLQVGHGRGLAGDHAGLHQQARGPVWPAVWRQWSQWSRLRQWPGLPLLHIILHRLQFPHPQPLRGRHHGQLRLPDTRLVHPGTSSSGRICSTVVRVRPGCEGQDQTRGRGDSAEEDLSSPRVWKALPPPCCL